MVIYTPRGLKIKLQYDYVFALIARVYPKADAFKVLETTEGLESIPSLLTFITGFICFYMRLSLFEIGLYVFIASIIGLAITSFGLYVIPGIVKLGTFYSYISGYGILLILLAVYGYITVGWQGVLVFFATIFLGGIIKIIIESIQMKRLYLKTGMVLSASDKNFINAYRLYANKLGITTDITVSDEELEEENWMPVFDDLVAKWPKLVKRFTSN